jgi:hypothetical protein
MGVVTITDRVYALGADGFAWKLVRTPFSRRIRPIPEERKATTISIVNSIHILYEKILELDAGEFTMAAVPPTGLMLGTLIALIFALSMLSPKHLN